MTIESGAISAARELAGALFPGDAGYDEARVSFNGLLDRRPAVIVPCRTTDEVVAAVRMAREAGLPIAVRGGGHSVAGHSLPDDAFVVSLAPMRDIVIEPERRLGHAGGGALWNDVDAAAFAFDLAVPGGTFGDTGIGGLTLGGGIGWLMPVAGLTCDNLAEAEVVTADGSVVIAGPNGDPELLWALRGGGGNFGVVTRFTYQLTPIAPMFGGSITWPGSAAAEVHDRIERLVAEHPTTGLPLITIARNAETGATDIALTYGIVDGSDPAPILDLLRRELPVVAEDLGPQTYLDLQARPGTLPFGLRHYWKGHFTGPLDGDLFGRLVEAVEAEDCVDDAFVLLERMVGAGTVEPPGGSAFGQRAAAWNASGISIWEDPALDDVAIGWARRVAAMFEPASLTGAGYVNYSPVDESPDRVRAAYGDERWTRLAGVKRRYDPDNVFRFNHNILPG